jgi:hypothetical protein
MRTPPDPEDPEHSGAAAVRPFLRDTAPVAARFRPLGPVDRPPPEPVVQPPVAQPPVAVPAGRMEESPPPPGEQTTSLRPFVITSGRVDTPDPDIGIETQVTAHPGAAPARLPPEKRAIVALCAQPLSVAEISARLRLHLGVTRILVGDLRATGQLDVHVLENDFPDPETIMRVIRGLRAIS